MEEAEGGRGVGKAGLQGKSRSRHPLGALNPAAHTGALLNWEGHPDTPDGALHGAPWQLEEGCTCLHPPGEQSQAHRPHHHHSTKHPTQGTTRAHEESLGYNVSQTRSYHCKKWLQKKRGGLGRLEGGLMQSCQLGGRAHQRALLKRESGPRKVTHG